MTYCTRHLAKCVIGWKGGRMAGDRDLAGRTGVIVLNARS